VRIALRPRRPVWVLALLAPAIPELLTGSTPVSRLFVDPPGFFVSFGFDVWLYGTGALLVREASVLLRKGWASVLLWGAAYGIGEEGFAVHTFFERAGPPVGALEVYGSAYGVNWLWALGLTVFLATYSIALPILLTRLWYPGVRGLRWFDRGGAAALPVLYLAVVATFAVLVGHGPSAAAFGAFLGIALGLLVLGAVLPGEAIGAQPGPRRTGRWGPALAGALELAAWLFVLVVSGAHRLSAWTAAGVLVALDGFALYVLARRIGTVDVERSLYAVAVGMLVPLFLWDALLEVSVPGILGVAAIFAYLLYRLGRTIDRRRTPAPASPG
jgi:hypothetical protein